MFGIFLTVVGVKDMRGVMWNHPVIELCRMCSRCCICHQGQAPLLDSETLLVEAQALGLAFHLVGWSFSNSSSARSVLPGLVLIRNSQDLTVVLMAVTSKPFGSYTALEALLAVDFRP